MDEKRRRRIEVYQSIIKDGVYERTLKTITVATGILYDEGNIQITWRSDIGQTSEQYYSISQLFGIVEGANMVKICE